MIAEPILAEMTKTPLPAQPQGLLRRLLASQVLCADRWDGLAGDLRGQLSSAPDDDALLTGLLGCELLTPYQFGRIRAVGRQPAGPDRLSPRCDEALLLAYRQARRNAALPG